MAAGLFKKKQSNLSADLKDMSVSEAALSQSTYNVEKITDIQNKFRGGEILLVPGRIFIRDGVLWKVCRKGPKKRQFFLFNDILVYGTVISRGHYGNQHIMTLHNMSVSSDCHYMPQVDLEGNNNNDDESSSPSELKPENAFQINHSDKSFHVYAHSKADKGNWISNLNKQITKVSKSHDPSDHVYQRAVWVPDSASKQCMICKQKFSAFVRKHHCRMCGRVVCSTCSPEKADIAKLSGAGTSGKVERICKTCKKPVILVTGGGVVGSEKSDDDTIEVASKQTLPVNADDGEDSSETEDSDDSETEETPIAPPRKKRQQQTINKSPEQKRRGPPPRPSYTPAKPNKAAESEKTVISDEKKVTDEKQSLDATISDNNDDISTTTTTSGENITTVEETATCIKSDKEEETDSNPVNQDEPSQPSNSKKNPTRPPRPNSGPPRPTIGPTIGPPRTGSASQRPVPKPRKTVVKKDDEKESGSGCATPTSMGSPSQNSKSPEQSSNTHPETEDIDTHLETEDVDGGSSKDEDHIKTEEADDLTNQQEDIEEQVDELKNHQEQDVESNEETKSIGTKRRKQKITKSNEEESKSIVTESTDINSSASLPQPVAADQLPPMEKSARSPSTHARQRRSKFTTTPSQSN